MPKEYIERETVMSDIKNLSVFLGGNNIFNKTAKDSVLDIIFFQPTADVVEVVRCKDCKFHTDEEPGMVYCPAILGNWVNDDWFCKDGERRTE